MTADRLQWVTEVGDVTELPADVAKAVATVNDVLGGVCTYWRPRAAGKPPGDWRPAILALIDWRP